MPAVVAEDGHLGIFGERQRIVFIFKEHNALLRCLLRDRLCVGERLFLAVELKIDIIAFEIVAHVGHDTSAAAEKLIHIRTERVHDACNGDHQRQQHTRDCDQQCDQIFLCLIH